MIILAFIIWACTGSDTCRPLNEKYATLQACNDDIVFLTDMWRQGMDAFAIPQMDCRNEGEGA